MKNLLSLLAVLFTISLSAQSDSTSLSKIQLFLDCQTNCDFRFFRQELRYVDFMRDRQEAEVFMQLIRQRSGNGGGQYSLQIKGLESQCSKRTIAIYSEIEVGRKVAIYG